MYDLKSQGKVAKQASLTLMNIGTEAKNKALLSIADALEANVNAILQEIEKDIKLLMENPAKASFADRLKLNEERISAMADGVRKVASLPDPVGEVTGMVTRPNGLVIGKKRVPLGVIGIIYEARPNVTVDAAVLCLKTSNACILRGGSEAINSNKILTKIMRKAISKYVCEDVITLIEDTDRKLVLELIQSKGYVDLVVPRGGKNLINNVVENSKVPFIETGAGNCHIYVDDEADLDMALNVIMNAKVSRPSVCNAVESILINDKIKERFLPLLKQELEKFQVEIRGCNETRKYINVDSATEEDFYQEYNDYIVSIKIVNNLEEAINHINKYGTKHSDAIITTNIDKANTFLNEIDSACVYVNASTRFTDGSEFGFGAELGISTQKLHARGPMGLKEMTTYKYKIYGSGEVR